MREGVNGRGGKWEREVNGRGGEMGEGGLGDRYVY